VQIIIALFAVSIIDVSRSIDFNLLSRCFASEFEFAVCLALKQKQLERHGMNVQIQQQHRQNFVKNDVKLRIVKEEPRNS